jgi:hypothetical protein
MSNLRAAGDRVVAHARHEMRRFASLVLICTRISRFLWVA